MIYRKVNKILERKIFILLYITIFTNELLKMTIYLFVLNFSLNFFVLKNNDHINKNTDSYSVKKYGATFSIALLLKKT